MMRKFLFVLLIISSCSVTNAKRIATGGGHNLVIKADGSLWAWGGNDYGQLGNGEKGNGEFGDYHFTPVKIMDDVVQITAGNYHTLAVKTDGSLWGWGLSLVFGNGETDVLLSASPVKIMDDVVQVAAGYGYTLVIKTDRSLWAWGSNFFGELGDGTKEEKPSPIKIMDDVVQVAAGDNHSLAVKTDGSLWAWGLNNLGQIGNGNGETVVLSPVKIMDDVALVAAGSYHTLATKTDGSLWAWGSNYYGELGDGTTIPKAIPVKIFDNISHISAGLFHSVAISSDNILYSWGINDYMGILVDGTSNATLLPTSIYKEVLEVDASGDNTIFLTSDGSVFAFGDNSTGQLGYENTDSNVPVKVPLDDVVDVAAGGNTSFAITSLDRLYGWGDDHESEIGDEDCKSKTRPVMVDGMFTQIAIGSGRNSVALKNDKTLWEWGSNCSYSGERRKAPTQTQTGYIQISAGDRRIFGIKEDHSLWAWGNNNYGTLGIGNTDNQKEPIIIMEDVAQVAAGEDHTLAIKTDGSLWAWGKNFYGQLGDGTQKDKASPVKIIDGGVSQIAAGDRHSLALMTDGSLWAWGDNDYGQLGDGTQKDKASPVKIIDGGVSQVAAGDTHSLAIMTDGSLYSWGENEYGQLGTGKAGNSYEQNYPIKIMDAVTKIAAGSEHTLAVKTDGSLWAWGKNSHGQLGQGTKNYSEVPVYVMNIGITQDVIKVYNADNMTYLLRSDKTALVKAIRGSVIDAVDAVIPDKIEYESEDYYVTAIGDSVFQKWFGKIYVKSAIFPSTIKSVSSKAFWGDVPLSIIWNSNTKIPASSFDSSLYDKGNFLLYVNNANIAPSEVKNIVVNGIADEIVLKDGHEFYCPQEFTAKKISYTHNYSMETGYNECAGWETIVLPFDVSSITHSSKGELTPMTLAGLNSDKKPFWLYELSDRGFVAASRFFANTPYLISMPNNPHYSSYYNLSGSVSFSATNATIKKSYGGVSSNNEGAFHGNYSLRSLFDDEYAINVNNDLTTYTGPEKPGSIFISNFRDIKPFECYYEKKSSKTRSIDIVFADGDVTTGIIDISQKEEREDKQVRVYNLSGQLVDVINGDKSSVTAKKLPAGVYIINGKKVVVQPK